MKEAEIITDGSANNTKGDGGWAAIIRVDSTLIELSGHAESTTSNRMELMAAIQALKHLNTPHKVRLISDSAYMLKALNNRWYEGWFKQERPRPNLDLWHVLVGLVNYHDVEFVKVKGHSGDYWNDRVDYVASEARKGQKSTYEVREGFHEATRCGTIQYERQCSYPVNHLGECYFSNRKYSFFKDEHGTNS